jgi:hypothetical protein
MKSKIILFLLVLINLQAFAQTYGNEWINYSQKYYAFPVTQSRVYRLPFATIQEAGVPVDILQVGQYRIYGKQKEIPIWVNDADQNGLLNDGEFLEFYAERNTGWLDSLLYDNPVGIANPQYSLYNDTLLYYLTWSQSNDGLRFQQETDVNYNNYPFASYVLSTVNLSINTLNQRYYEGTRNNNGSSSFFTDGEGWGRGHLNGVDNDGTGQSFNLPVSGYFTGTGAPQARLHAKVTSNSNASANGINNHHLQLRLNGNTYFDTVYNGYRQIRNTTFFNPTVFTSNTAVFNMVIPNSLGAATDFQGLTYVQLDFAKNLAVSASSRLFNVVNHPTSLKQTYQFTSLSGTNPFCYVWDGSIPKRLIVTAVGNVNRFVVVPKAEFNAEQKLFIFTDASIGTIDSIIPINGTGLFSNYTEQNYESSLIFVHHPTLTPGVQLYKEYRESSAGGSYNVRSINVEELYHQYGGGIQGHALAIRRFLKQVYDQTVEKPVGLFLIGKAVREAEESGAQPGTRKNVESFGVNLVPSFGFPSSDIGFTAKFTDNSWAPAIPTGRIAAKTSEDVISYLNKIKQYDLNQDPSSVYNSSTKDWQKHVIHFGGGTSPSEINQLSSFLNTMGNRVEDNKFGGKTNTYIKTNSDPFGATVLNEVKNRIDNGVSVMTFFSHAAGEGFEINIDQPDSWNNAGKYPLILGLSCYTGDMFLPFTASPAEKFVLLDNKGAIGFLSTVKQGFPSLLFQHANQLYNQFCLEGYGKTLGENLLATSNFLFAQFPNNLGMESTAMQMNLHGDPMIKINNHEKPEIEITNQSVSFNPALIDLATQELELNLVVKNLGRSITDTIAVEVRRNFPGQQVDSVYVQYLPLLNYTDTVKFTMPVQQNVAMGLNQFQVSVDIPSTSEEQYDEVNNNRLTTSYLIDIGGVLPVFPYNYAVIPNPQVSVVASTINPFSAERNYRFELDTTDLFNSPEHRFFTLTSLGGLLEVGHDQWLGANSGLSFPLICSDSTAYFWRVAQLGADTSWIEQSFQYIPDKIGWGQDHFFQFKNNNFSFLDYNREERRRNFFDYEASVRCNVYDNADNINTWEGTNWYLNSALVETNICGSTPSIHVAVIDPLTLEPWKTQGELNGVIVNPQNSFNNANDYPNCRLRPEGYFIFRQNSLEQLQAFENFMTNVVPDSFYYLIYTPVNTQFDQWSTIYPEVYNVFTQLQSDSIYPGRPNRSFIFFGKKGTDFYNNEVVAQFPGEFITMEQSVPGVSSFGLEKSVQIGPAANWNTLYWKQFALENPTSDSTVLRVSGLDWGGNELTHMEFTFSEQDSLLNLNDTINASEYPYLRLRSSHWDDVNLNPAQIDRWHVLYEALPEAAIDASNGFYWSLQNNPAQEGELVKFAVDIVNVSNIDMDSILIKYWIQDQNMNKIELPYPRQDSLKAGQLLRDTIVFSTSGMFGNRSLWIEVNPYVNGSTILKDQPEQFHFNNIAQIPFVVNRDEVNPILDVTFDGVHILNGDIVSPKSEVVITLKDENPFLIMNSDADTSLFSVYLKDPNGIQRRVYFVDGNGQINLEWIPASSATNNKFKIIYRADFPLDGKYQLLVQGQDISGNVSGDLSYKVDFEVIRESTISYLMNYPNPFSTNTRFVFTLTGDKIPDHMTIQIMTVTGKIIREITMAELGSIRIGRNVTDYAWDGRDEFGDPLANGVYLYRVMTSLDGERIKHRESGADEFFKKEFGKMYLMR